MHLYNLNDNVGQRLKYDYTNMSKWMEEYIINFFCTQRGKHQRFWLPVWKNSFILQSNINTNDTVITVNDTFFRYIDQGQERIFFLLKNGDYISRQVIAVVQAGANETFTIQTPMDRDLTQNDIEFFGRLLLVRFSTDRLDITHLSDRVSKVSLNFSEVANEYEPEVLAES